MLESATLRGAAVAFMMFTKKPIVTNERDEDLNHWASKAPGMVNVQAYTLPLFLTLSIYNGFILLLY